MKPPAELAAALEDLALRRPDCSFGVEWHESLPSTMDVVATAAASGRAGGHVVIADLQTAGRGRRGRTWHSPPGAGLYFSYLARPTRHIGLVTLAAGVGVVAGVGRSTGVQAHLKWPNDLLVGSRKLAGLLAEGVHLGAPGPAVVIGVGVNLAPAPHPPDVAARATDLETERGSPVSRFEVFTRVLEHLADALAALEADRAGDILQAWRAASPSAFGTAVSWSDGSTRKSGFTAGIDDEGALLVRTPTGTERILGGELQWDLLTPSS